MIESQTLQSAQPGAAAEQQIEAHNQRQEAFLKELDSASFTPEEILAWAARVLRLCVALAKKSVPRPGHFT